MKIKVAVVVFNRFENIVRWINCWKQCEQMGAEFIVIHNYDRLTDIPKYQSLCTENGITYISRKNFGFDIGAFQDVCYERLYGFDNDWDYLLWLTDDTIPMVKNFIQPFIDSFTTTTGVTCMEISPLIKLHLRTTGFCIRKDVSRLIKFAVDPIHTKTHCYYFEHKGNKDSFLNQLRSISVLVTQVAPLEQSPLWDYHSRAYLKRMEEHEAVFT